MRKEQLLKKLKELVREAGEIGIGIKELAGWLTEDEEKAEARGGKEYD